MSRITYKKLLQTGNWVGYSDEIAKKFKCVLTSCLISFFLKKESDLNLENEWFYVTQEDVEKNLFIGEKPFFKIRNLLVIIGVLEMKYDGVPRRCYYRIPENFVDKINDFNFGDASNSQMEELKKYSPLSPNGRSKQLPNGGAVNSQTEEHSIIEYNYKEYNNKNIIEENKKVELIVLEKNKETYFTEDFFEKEKSCEKKEKEFLGDSEDLNLKKAKLPKKNNKASKSKEKECFDDLYGSSYMAQGRCFGKKSNGEDVEFFACYDKKKILISYEFFLTKEEKNSIINVLGEDLFKACSNIYAGWLYSGTKAALNRKKNNSHKEIFIIDNSWLISRGEEVLKSKKRTDDVFLPNGRIDNNLYKEQLIEIYKSKKNE